VGNGKVPIRLSEVACGRCECRLKITRLISINTCLLIENKLFSRSLNANILQADGMIMGKLPQQDRTPGGNDLSAT
jgi:hypothetical protein